MSDWLVVKQRFSCKDSKASKISDKDFRSFSINRLLENIIRISIHKLFVNQFWALRLFFISLSFSIFCHFFSRKYDYPHWPAWARYCLFLLWFNPFFGSCMWLMFWWWLWSGSQPEKLYSETNELVLDGGFPVPKDGFMAPEINSFGNSFRWF